MDLRDIIFLAALSSLPAFAAEAPYDTSNFDEHISLKETFSHELHAPAFKEEGITCTTCHLTLPLKNQYSKDDYDKIRKSGKAYAKSSCHHCHFGPERRREAPASCRLCHTSPPTPTNHKNADWHDNHGLSAKFQPQRCEQCHSGDDCTRCHFRRDTLKRDQHPRTFLFSHSIVARVKSDRCSRCHQVSFCTDCHARRTH